MIIRLGLMDGDTRYISRLADYFVAHPDETMYLELSLFHEMSDYNAFVECGERLDILLASISTLKNPDEVGNQVLVAYLSEENNLEKYEGHDVICKYQKAIKIFRKIQDLASRIHGNRGVHSSGMGRIVLFAGSAGGVGCTTAAVGFAARMARLGRKVVYLSYQQSAQPTLYFNQTGSSMSDLHYDYQEWLRMDRGAGRDQDNEDRKNRLQLKLISEVGIDSLTNIHCYDAFRLPVDALEIGAAEITDQIEALAGEFEECVVDMDGRIDESFLSVMRLCYWTIIVSDGTEKSNLCATRMLGGLKALNDSGEHELSREMGLLYTCFGSHSFEAPDLPDFVRVVGKIPRYSGAPLKAIVEDLSKSASYTMLEPLERRVDEK